VGRSRGQPQRDRRSGAKWRVIEPIGSDVLLAIDNAQRWQLSFWDAMIVAAAAKAEAEVLQSEDLQHGRRYSATTAMAAALLPRETFPADPCRSPHLRLRAPGRRGATTRR
jgi:hypothetical protein